METGKKGSIRLLAFLVGTILVLSGLTGYLFVNSFFLNGVLAEHPNFLDVSISPSGTTTLGVGQSQTFTATVANYLSFAPFTYTWTLTPNTNMTVDVSVDTGLVTLEKIWNLNTSQSVSTPAFSVPTISVSFPSAVNGGFSLSVMAVSSKGNQGSSAFVWVQDPYTQPNVYLNQYGMPYSYLIETDGLGWYQAISGVTGQTSWQATNATYVFQQAVNNANGIIEVSAGTFNFPTPVLINRNDVSIIGAGIEETILKMTGYGGDYAIFKLSTSSVTYEWQRERNILFQDLTMDANNEAYTSCIYSPYATIYVDINRVQFKNVEGWTNSGSACIRGIVSDYSHITYCDFVNSSMAISIGSMNYGTIDSCALLVIRIDTLRDFPDIHGLRSHPDYLHDS